MAKKKKVRAIVRPSKAGEGYVIVQATEKNSEKNLFWNVGAYGWSKMESSATVMEVAEAMRICDAYRFGYMVRDQNGAVVHSSEKSQV